MTSFPEPRQLLRRATVTRDSRYSRPRTSLILFSGLALALVAAGWGILSRLNAESALARATDDAAVPTVSVAVAQSEVKVPRS